MTSKNYRNHTCESFCYAKCTKTARATWSSLFSICVLRLALPMVIVVTGKTPKQLFYSRNTLFAVVEFSNVHRYFLRKCSFWRHINVSYNNQTGFSSQIVLLWVTCWHRSIKTLKHLIIDKSYNIGSSDVITNVNTMTSVNQLIFYLYMVGCNKIIKEVFL